MIPQLDYRCTLTDLEKRLENATVNARHYQAMVAFFESEVERYRQLIQDYHQGSAESRQDGTEKAGGPAGN